MFNANDRKNTNDDNDGCNYIYDGNFDANYAKMTKNIQILTNTLHYIKKGQKFGQEPPPPLIWTMPERRHFCLQEVFPGRH